MGKFYEQSIIPESFRRNFSVYDRINKLNIQLGTFYIFQAKQAELTQWMIQKKESYMVKKEQKK